MNRGVFTCLRVAGVALAIQKGALAQQCYYPNGAEAPEKPCSSVDGSACCPDKWQCLDNGLCYYEPDNLHGRYSCTDKSWKAPGCPSNMCTYDMSASGGESITQCSSHDGQWCCNADATHVNCCKESPEPRPFFVLQDGKAYATIGTSTASFAPDLASITGLATGSGSDSLPSSTPEPSSDSPSSDSPSASKAAPSSSPTPTKPTTPITSLQTRVSSGSAGVSTVILTIITQAPATSSTSSPIPSQTSDNKSKTPIIVGCAVGIPLGIALLGILIWLFRKRRYQKQDAHPYSETPDPYRDGSASPEFAGGAKLHKYTNGATKYKSEDDPGVPELAGQGIGPGRPFSTIKGRAELDSGAAFVPGAAAPHAPHLVGLGGGNGTGHTPQNSWGSAPPGYSPGMNANAWAPGHTQNTSVGSMQDGAAVGAGGGAAQTEGRPYIPYRPPPGHGAAQQGGGEGAGGTGLHNVPEMAELSAATSPPEVAELGTDRTPPAVAELGSGRTPPA